MNTAPDFYPNLIFESKFYIVPPLSDSWLDESEKQTKKTFKTKILEIVPAKCDSWMICDVDIFYSQIICYLDIFDIFDIFIKNYFLSP